MFQFKGTLVGDVFVAYSYVLRMRDFHCFFLFRIFALFVTLGSNVEYGKATSCSLFDCLSAVKTWFRKTYVRSDVLS